MNRTPLLSVKNLEVFFPITGYRGFRRTVNYVKAVNDISFDLFPGESLGIVGESGCGKSTLIRAVLNLIESTSGRVIWQGKEIRNLDEKKMVPFRKEMQIIFQDPTSSLNPRMTIEQIIGEPLQNFHPEMSKETVRKKVQTMMQNVGLNIDMVNRFPHEFSGGQCQRIGIARALILEPILLICDEPVSALDVSIQAQILNLLNRIRKEFNLSIIFISHDLSVIRYICDRLVVMYLGKVMEATTCGKFFDLPQHPYAKSLMAAVPDISGENYKKIDLSGVNKLKGEIPSPFEDVRGCVFNTRCPIAKEECFSNIPQNTSSLKDTEVYCHFPENQVL